MAGVKWSGATKRSRSRRPCRLPRPHRPRWLLLGGFGPASSSAGCGRYVRAPPPGRRGEWLRRHCRNPLMSPGPHLWGGAHKHRVCDFTWFCRWMQLEADEITVKQMQSCRLSILNTTQWVQRLQKHRLSLVPGWAQLHHVTPAHVPTNTLSAMCAESCVAATRTSVIKSAAAAKTANLYLATSALWLSST